MGRPWGASDQPGRPGGAGAQGCERRGGGGEGDGPLPAVHARACGSRRKQERHPGAKATQGVVELLRPGLEPPQTVEVESTPRPSTARPTRPPTTRPTPTRGAPARVETDDKREARKKFKRCQGRCVQEFCLPVESIPVYEKCVNKCKTFCT